MKNRRFLIPLLIVLCLICLFALASCSEEKPHAHTLIRHSAVEATCTTEGNLEYWECTACGKFFSDGSANTELDGLASTIIPVDTSAHAPATTLSKDGTSHWNACTRNGCTVELNKTTHTYGEWIETLAPSCVAEGSHYQTCSACSYKVSEAIPVDTSAHAPATTWTSDGTNHWNACTRSGCNAQMNKTAHVCDWQMDEANHWGTCATCGYDIAPTAHQYDAENTCICSQYKDSGVVFTLKNGTYTVTDYTGSASEVILPSKYKGVAVTAIGYEAFYDCGGLTSVTIPASVTSIGGGAFFYCSSLRTVTFDENSQLQSIGSSAFYECRSLASISIPAGVTSIGNSAFYACNSLASISIPAGVTSIGDDAFCSCDSLTTVEFGANSQLTSIGEDAFYDCSSLASISIPAGVKSIGSDAFRGCSSLASISIPAGVKSIGDLAFYGCSILTGVYITDIAAWCKISFDDDDANPLCYGGNLYLNGTLVTELVIPSGVTSIGSYAFYGCDSLANISIPAGVTSIGSGAFSNCLSLTTVTFGENSQLQRIGSDAFRGCSSLASISIPAGVTSIGSDAFYYCGSLTTVTFGENSQLQSIGEWAFYYCSSLTTVTFGENSQLTSIGDLAFSYCSSLASISIPAGVTSIGSWAFAHCSKLTSVTIPASVTSISDYAFYGCSSLASITFEEPSGWYRTNSYSDWKKKTGGTATSLADPATNATYFKSTYRDDYWYKL